MVREESGEGGKGEPTGVGGGGVDLDLLHRLQQQHQGGVGGRARHAWSPPVINTTDGSQERTVASLLLERRGANGDGCGKMPPYMQGTTDGPEVAKPGSQDRWHSSLPWLVV